MCLIQGNEEARKITRVILAGNSLSQPVIEEEVKKPVSSTSSFPSAICLTPRLTQKRYGYDSSTYSDKPTAALDAFLSEILPSLSVDLLSGESDPTGPTLPQQPLHPAMLEGASQFEGFTSRTNPFWCDIGGARYDSLILESSGIRD